VYTCPYDRYSIHYDRRSSSVLYQLSYLAARRKSIGRRFGP
jgi:hypothetical protein